MNPNYAVVVKHDQHELLTIGFITLVKEVTWFSPIAVVPKKMVNYAFASILRDQM
jgi:hypothetical protein